MKITDDQLLDLISQEALIDREKLTREATLADLGMSSIDVITLLFEIEERYGVLIEAGDIPQVQSLGEFTDFLRERINADPS